MAPINTSLTGGYQTQVTAKKSVSKAKTKDVETQQKPAVQEKTAANDSGVPCVEYSTSVAPTDSMGVTPTGSGVVEPSGSGVGEEPPVNEDIQEQIETARPTAKAPDENEDAARAQFYQQTGFNMTPEEYAAWVIKNWGPSASSSNIGPSPYSSGEDQWSVSGAPDWLDNPTLTLEPPVDEPSDVPSDGQEINGTYYSQKELESLAERYGTSVGHIISHLQSGHDISELGDSGDNGGSSGVSNDDSGTGQSREVWTKNGPITITEYGAAPKAYAPNEDLGEDAWRQWYTDNLGPSASSSDEMWSSSGDPQWSVSGAPDWLDNPTLTLEPPVDEPSDDPSDGQEINGTYYSQKELESLAERYGTSVGHIISHLQSGGDLSELGDSGDDNGDNGGASGVSGDDSGSSGRGREVWTKNGPITIYD